MSQIANHLRDSYMEHHQIHNNNHISGGDSFDLEENEKENTITYSSRVPPPETHVMKSKINQNKTRILKSSINSILAQKGEKAKILLKTPSIENETQPRGEEKRAPHSGEQEKKENAGNGTSSGAAAAAATTTTAAAASAPSNKLINDLQNNGRNSMNKLQFLFYQMVLIVCFIYYGTFRYFQFNFNTTKLKLLSIVYNPSHTPQLIRQDVNKLSKIPKRLAAILEMKSIGDIDGGINGLLNDGSEVVCWTISAGIKHLILYDYDGVLKKNINLFRQEIHNNLTNYYGPKDLPKYCIKIPHLNKLYYNNVTDDEGLKDEEENKKVSIEITLLSVRDGRETIVDLTKTMNELYLHKKLQEKEITMDLINNELIQLVGHEPDLLLYFGPSLDLQGFPPWHIRLTEFYWETDNNEVSYLVFIRGLKEYSNCKINLGK
ncbi:hypothetical protein TBLA_0A05890 [Henningerozyma blattae CBS 6284]|uniref:ditrans,polycis-polyprenyl diphosphate synthase [(2E,6E)-farnesyldiphosphate specific] n=1 Tax=Henningerozyma blattae (strain ATCC 34711 / CBS 6284 / DSM 70876 / NBRC 10599 / NRRL Y-10934 / UCD 77-7) TaxID=1071380 RepID=I2GW80_HENB6|nr:hypothetical protein TBLA_0A05890 [Tetrapisispora blattae CBS 6284]CCH58382.1 hypothetical protein TBLA_0A05890 [Tetrapisispora blattae CBS 6284]